MSETTKPRLIDANALKARLIKYHDGFSSPYDAHTMGMMVAIRECIDRIESAPNVDIISEETNWAIWQYAEENDVSKWIIHWILKIIQTPFNE